MEPDFRHADRVVCTADRPPRTGDCVFARFGPERHEECTFKRLDGLTPDGKYLVLVPLNPEYDTSDLMMAVASAYGFTHPEFRYVNGDPAVMRDLLTRMQFSPVKNPETGAIDHANLFIVVDPQGRIAYRFNLDPRHRSWLREAVISLTAEARGAATPHAAP